MPEAQNYVFDDGPLSHFAEAGWLGLLDSYVGEGNAILPETVHRELSDGVSTNPHLRSVLDADWLNLRMLVSGAEHAAFAKFSALLVGTDSRKNLGECGVLAIAQVTGEIAVIDDSVARKIANANGIEYKTTLGILTDLVRAGDLSLKLASRVADHLIRTEYRLPFDEGGFHTWALMNDLLPDS
jgi:predicted nucleic acid-binding protein